MVSKADGEIVYKIEIDDSDYKKSFKDFEEEAAKTGEAAGEGVKGGFAGVADSISKTLKDAFENVPVGEIIASTIITGGVTAAVEKTTKLVSGAVRVLRSYVATTAKVGTSIFGIVEALGTIGIAFNLLGSWMGESEDRWVRFAGKIVFVAGLIANAVAVGIAWAFKKLGDIMVDVGTKMVRFFQSATKMFTDFNRDSIVLNAFITNFNRVSQGAIGTIDEWNVAIDSLSDSLNTGVGSLRKASAEIISVGQKIGLTKDQMLKLLEVSAAYGKIAHKDVFQTSVALVGALNGNAQAVQAYGIKLNQAAVQQFAFAHGINQSLEKMGEHEVVQLRFNKLLKQYGVVADIATETAETLADQTARYTVVSEKLNASLGKGASLIETNVLGLKVLNGILSNVNETVLATVGFIGALSGRVLQIVGFYVKWSFVIFGVIKAFRLFDAAVKSGFALQLLSKTVPLINRSMLDLTKLIPGIGSGMKQSAGLGGNAMKALKNAMSASFSVLSKGVKLFFNFKFLLVTFAVFLATVFVKAIAAVEERTKVFTTLWKGLTGTVGDSESTFQGVADVFTEIGRSIASITDKAFGVAVSLLTKKMIDFLSVLSIVPFMSDRLSESISRSIQSLGGLRSELASVGQSFSQLPEHARRGLAGMKKEIEVNVKELASIREKFGQTEIEKLKSQFESQNSTLQNALIQQLITQKNFQELSSRLYTDYLEKLEQVRLKQEGAFAKPNEGIAQSFQNIWQAMKTTAANVKITATQIAKTMQDNIANGAANAFSSFGKALANGEDALGAFINSLIGTMGQMAVQLGTMFIAQGLAYLWAGLPNGGALIAAGAALATIGGVMSALSGGGASMDTGASESFSASPEITALTQDDEIDRVAGTEINVSVMGNVFDRRETGLEIVRTINEVVESDNITINRRALA